MILGAYCLGWIGAFITVLTIIGTITMFKVDYKTFVIDSTVDNMHAREELLKMEWSNAKFNKFLCPHELIKCFIYIFSCERIDDCLRFSTGNSFHLLCVFDSRSFKRNIFYKYLIYCSSNKHCCFLQRAPHLIKPWLWLQGTCIVLGLLVALIVMMEDQNVLIGIIIYEIIEIYFFICIYSLFKSLMLQIRNKRQPAFNPHYERAV